MNHIHKTSCLTVAATASVVLSAASATAAPLNGSGTLPVPNPNPGIPNWEPAALSNINHPISFTSTWASPAAPAWIGSFQATGPVPSSPNSGTTTYDFSTLASNLPAATFFSFGDVDGGSGGGETFRLQAFNSGVPITAPWLNPPVGAWGTGQGPAGAILATDMPDYSFDSLTGIYTIDGSNVPGNPAIGFALTTVFSMDELVLVKATTTMALAWPRPCRVPPAPRCSRLAV